MLLGKIKGQFVYKTDCFKYANQNLKCFFFQLSVKIFNKFQASLDLHEHVSIYYAYRCTKNSFVILMSKRSQLSKKHIQKLYSSQTGNHVISNQ